MMLNLEPGDLANGVLDCGGGPASFVAELVAEGCRAVAVDPVYSHSGPEIRSRFETVAESIISQVRATPERWLWSFHGDPDGLLTIRRLALNRFLADYDQGRLENRYLAGQLPSLPFATQSFGVAVCTHLLFLYSDALSESFHVQAVRELCRVSREVRIFPLLTLGHLPSPHVAAVRSAVGMEGWNSEIVTVNYELQRGSNQMLRIFRER